MRIGFHLMYSKKPKTREMKNSLKLRRLKKYLQTTYEKENK